jgi:hypothetical protein
MKTLKAFIGRVFGEKRKSVLFVDGDMSLVQMDKILHEIEHNFDEICLVRLNQKDFNEPKIIRRIVWEFSDKINYFLVHEWRKGKESTDKFIIAAIQKAVMMNACHIAVLTSDFDFVDVYDIISQINPESEIKFEVFMPKNMKYTKHKHEFLIKYV